MNTISELESVILEDSLLHQNLLSILCVSASVSSEAPTPSMPSLPLQNSMDSLLFSTPVTRWNCSSPWAAHQRGVFREHDSSASSVRPAWAIFSVKTWRTQRIQTHEGTEFEWEEEDRAEIELQQSYRVTAEPSFPSYVAAATPTVPRQEWHATWMQWKWGLSRDFPLNKEKHTLCRNTLTIKNKNKMNLCFTVVPNR